MPMKPCLMARSGAIFRIQLLEEHRTPDSCQHSAEAGVTKQFPENFQLEFFFTNFQETSKNLQKSRKYSKNVWLEIFEKFLKNFQNYHLKVLGKMFKFFQKLIILQESFE